MTFPKCDEASIGWDLKVPCPECPFRVSVPVDKKGIQDLPELVETLQSTGHIAHSCHRTAPRADYANPQPINGKVQACAGFTLFALKSKMPSGPMLRAYARGEINVKKLRKHYGLVHDLKDLCGVYKDWLIEKGMWNHGWHKH